MQNLLWGYPDVLRVFMDRVLPVLQSAEERLHDRLDATLPTPGVTPSASIRSSPCLSQLPVVPLFAFEVDTPDTRADPGHST